MKGLQKALKDKSTNNMVVALLVGFATFWFIQGIATVWGQGPDNFWHGQVWRNVIGYVVTLVVAEIVSWMAK